MDVLTSTLAAEFSDIGDAGQLLRILLRLLLASLLGALLGLERELTGKPAGLRTHMLVALGSAMFVLAAQGSVDEEGMSRVIQGLLAGVGFLCAGAILKSSTQEHVYGLTTAAGLWMTAAIGLAAGLGREALAVVSTLITLGILLLERPVQRWLDQRKPPRAVLLREDDAGS